MRILFFLEDYYLGGVDTFVINLINNWPNNNDYLVLICNKQHTGLNFIRESLIRPCEVIKHNILIFNSFFELKDNKIINKFSIFLLKLSVPILRYIFLFYNVLALKKVLLNKKADRLMVINGGYPGGDSCRAASICWGLFSKKPLSIHNFHGIVSKTRWHVRYIDNIVDAYVSKYSRSFVTVSKAAAETMKNRSVITKNNNINIIYNGITFSLNRNMQSKANIKQEIGIPETSKLCLMLGGYHQHRNFDKGHEFLFKSFTKIVSQCPDVHLLICGYGSPEDMERVRSILNKYKLNSCIHLSGFRYDIPNILSQTDVVVIASQAFESFCLSSIEAMAASVPVVATDVGAISEIIKNGEGGFCVYRNNVELFAKRVAQLLNDDSLRMAQGKKGLQRYQRFFTAERMTNEYAKLIYRNNE